MKKEVNLTIIARIKYLMFFLEHPKSKIFLKHPKYFFINNSKECPKVDIYNAEHGYFENEKFFLKMIIIII